MKKGDKFVLLLLLFVALLILAGIGYRLLSEHYSPPEIPFSGAGTENGSSIEETTANNETTDTDTASGSTEPINVPDFTVYDLEGNAVSLYDCLGKPVVLNFWATWCGPCRSEMPAFEKMYQQYKDEVTFLMVNVTDGSRDTIESVTAFYEDSGYSFPIFFDTTLEASINYGAYSIPLTFFIDKEGNLLYNQTGAISEQVLEQCMELLVQTDTSISNE